MKKSVGLTLIEVLVVIAMMAILTAIFSLNIFRILPSIRLSGAARNLVLDLKKAQRYAIEQQFIYEVRFLTSENKYQIIKKTNIPVIIISEVSLPEEISFGQISFEPPLVDFNAAGLPSVSGTIILNNQAGRSATIEIEPAGFIKVNQ